MSTGTKLKDLRQRHLRSVVISSVSSAFTELTSMYTRYQELKQPDDIISKYIYSIKIQRLVSLLKTKHKPEWNSLEFKGDRELNEQRFVILVNEFQSMQNKIIQLFNEAKTQPLLVEKNIRDIILSRITSWPYTKNGMNFCAFLSYLASITINGSYITFFSKYKPEQQEALFCTTLFNLFHDALITSVNDGSSKSKWERILKLIGNQIVIKNETRGNYFSITEALKILNFDTPEIISALQRADIGAGNCVTLNFCSNRECQRIMDGVGPSIKQIVKWKDLDVEKHLIPLIQIGNCKSGVIESNLSCIYSEVNILAGGHPMGICECGHTKFSIIFRHPTTTNTITFGHSLGLYSNFDLNKLNDIPVIGLDKLIYKYEANTLYINKPVNTHWFDVVINWDDKSVVKLNSSGGEVSYHDFEWLHQQKAFIAGMVVVKKDVAPVNTTDPLELILSSIQLCTVTSNDVKFFQPRFLTKLMEDRNIWELFSSEVSTKTYYSKVTKKVNDKTVKPGDKIKFDSESDRLSAKIWKAADYRHSCSIKIDRLKDVMTVWANNFEQNWIKSYANLDGETLNLFKETMRKYWNRSGNIQIEEIILVQPNVNRLERKENENETQNEIVEFGKEIDSNGIQIGNTYSFYNINSDLCLKVYKAKVLEITKECNENWYKIQYTRGSNIKRKWVSADRFLLD
eukprot:361659_1